MLAWAVAARAGDPFPPIDEQARTLREVPGAPEAPAVVLFKRAEFRMMDIAKQEPSSRLSVSVRVKVLKPQGMSWGEVVVVHTDDVRLQNFQGRTVLPDGRVVPLPGDAKFRRTLSKARGLFVTAVAFPAVETGAILDYRYDLRFDSIYMLRPWFLSEDVPVLHAEILYRVPAGIRAEPWGSNAMKVELKSERVNAASGGGLRIWADALPAVPDEPHGVPFADMATQFMLIPVEFDNGDARLPLLDGWPSVCKLFSEGYDRWRKKGNQQALATRVTEGAATPSERARRLFEHVRDRIVTEGREGVSLPEGSTPEAVLARGTGTYAEKALLLQSLLEAAGLGSGLVWAFDRSQGLADLHISNPAWFQRVLVAVELDGASVFLDPSDRGLAFGGLAPEIEGTEAVVFDEKSPKLVTLPRSSFVANLKRSVLDLALDGDGRLTGHGELLFTGHHFHRFYDATRSADEGRRFWQDWLEKALPDLRVRGLSVTESVEARQLHLAFDVEEREETVLGDEATLSPSRPLGPARQDLTQPAMQRRSPVRFAFPDREEVELHLRFAPGWRVDAAPRPASHESPVGALSVEVALDPAQRTISYKRRFDVRQSELTTTEGYEQARALLAAVTASDAEALALLRR